MSVVFEARRVGSRPATRVTIAAPQGSRWNGRVGTIVEIVASGRTVLVRFAPDEPAIPFGIGEVEGVR